MGLSLVGAATAAILVFVFYSSDKELATKQMDVLVGVVTAAASVASLLWRRARPTGVARLPLGRAADALAKQLLRQWEQVADERGLIHPAPIPLRWRWSLRPVTGPAEEAVQGPFAPLPKLAVVTVEDLQSGTLRDLYDIYGGLGSGRLIVLGQPGAGKSSAGIWLLRDALAHRDELTSRDRARVPVPVLVSPQGWDPTVERFDQWLGAWLARNYAPLRAPEYGTDAAMDLIAGNHLAVILDGLDEMPQEQRSVALRALDEQVITFRLVVLTRSRELVAAVRGGGHLQGAAALELLPIDAEQAAQYVAASGRIDPLPAPWQHVVDHLRKYPEGVVAQALTTPLMLSLVRDTYGPGERVDELLDGDRFATREAIEDHLLDRVLPAAYTPHPSRSVPYTADQARRWLGQLARQMNEAGTHDLTWWQIPRWVPTWPRAVVTVAVTTIFSVLSAFLIWSLSGLAAHMDPHAAAQAGLPTTLAALFGDALGYAFMFGAGLLLMSSPGEGSRRRDGLRWSRTEILMIVLLGLGVGYGYGLEQGILNGPKHGFAAGLTSSFVVGLGFILSGGPPQRLGRLRWIRADTCTNLRPGLVVGLVSGLVSGPVVGLVAGRVYKPEYMLMTGFIVGIGYLLVIVFGGRPSPQQGQLRGRRTNTLTTILIGFIIGTVSTAGYGIIYVLMVILGGRTPLLRSRPRWSRIETPTMLLTGLATGLIAGLVYGSWFGLVYRFVYESPLPFWHNYWLVTGLVYGLAFGLIGLLLGLRQPSTETTSAFDPPSLWRRERQFGLALGLVVGLVMGLALGLASGLVVGLAYGLAYGLTVGLVVGLGLGLMSSATWTATLAGVQLWRRGEAPARLLRFLDDARERQILRTVGPVYQFRHARLQDRLEHYNGALACRERLSAP
jgi:hypothetical protein